MKNVPTLKTQISQTTTASSTVNLYRPFGPMIAVIKMPDELVKNLNVYTDTVIDSSPQLDHGDKLVGNVKQERRIEPDAIQNLGWGKFLFDCVKFWVNSASKKTITKFEIHSSWIVRQFENEYNPAHTHQGHISGVGYLKLPRSFGETVQQGKNINKNGCIDFIHGSQSFLSPSILSVTPEVGDLYLFPNHLMHSVYPFFGEGERRSVSFNASIDSDIYNSLD